MEKNTTLPVEVISAEKNMKLAGFTTLGQLRWHWCKNPENTARVSMTTYSALCGVTRQAVSQSVGAYMKANPTVESAPNVSPLGGSTKGVRKVKAVGPVAELDGVGGPTKTTLRKHLRELLALGTSVATEFQAVAPTMTPDQLSTALAQFSAVADTLREAITPPKFTAVAGLSEVEVVEVPVAA